MKILPALNRFALSASTVAVLFAAAVGAMSAASWAQINPAVLPSAGPLSKQSTSRLLLTDVARSGNRLVAVGDRGYVIFSDNNGESWARAKSPANLPLLNGVYFSDANTAWAVGHDSVILKSTDQGKEWVQVHSSTKDPRALMDIVFTDANTGFAVGAYGAYYETTDAGKSWASRKLIEPVAVAKPAKAQPAGRGGRGEKPGKGPAMDFADDAEKSSDEDRHLNAIIKLADKRLFIAGEAGTLALSADNGKNWSRLASPYKGSFFGAVAADDGAVIIYGLRGNVYRSTDASLKAWKQIDTGTKASMMGATKLADGAVVLAGLSGTMLLSRDGGKSFAALASGTTKPLAAPVAGAANLLLVVGESGAREVPLVAATAKK